MGKYLVLLFMISLVAGCATPISENHSVTLMTFNVENLFDTDHDEGKNDYTYLPLRHKASQSHQDTCREIEVERWRDQCLYWDWNEQVLDEKLKRIATVVKQVNGIGADIIAFQEVENVKVLDRLRTDYLAGSGYRPPVLLEGDDERGIDVAFLSRLSLVGEPKLHRIEFEQISERREADTRGILEASFRLPDGDVLTGFAVHFPAPYHPFKLRIDAYKTLEVLLNQQPKDRLVFAAGDFNTPSREDAEQNMLARFVDPQWHIAHRTCVACPGTNYFGREKSWSFLDMILLSKSFKTTASGGWWFDTQSVVLANNAPFQKTDQGTPARFDLLNPSGISDHWPLTLSIRGTSR